MNIKKILYEPFFHFLILGAVLYLYYENVNTVSAVNTQKIIKLSPYKTAQLNTTFKTLFHREASSFELDAMVKEFYNRRVLIDEALTLELYKSDTVILKRLVEKMKYIILNSTILKEPTEDELRQYYKNHLENYSKTQSISFSHIYFKNLDKKQEEFITELLQTGGVDPENAQFFGDKFDGENSIKDMKLLTCKKIFGNYFTSQIVNLMPMRWSGIIHSKQGVHFVYVQKKYAKNIYDFDEIEYRVYNDYIEDRKISSYENAFKKIALQYKLEKEK